MNKTLTKKYIQEKTKTLYAFWKIILIVIFFVEVIKASLCLQLVNKIKIKSKDSMCQDIHVCLQINHVSSGWNSRTIRFKFDIVPLLRGMIKVAERPGEGAILLHCIHLITQTFMSCCWITFGSILLMFQITGTFAFVGSESDDLVIRTICWHFYDDMLFLTCFPRNNARCAFLHALRCWDLFLKKELLVLCLDHCLIFIFKNM